MGDLLTVDSHHFSDGEAVPGLVGHAPALREILARLPTLAEAEGAVLISGETGRGKELVATAIHRSSPWASCRFVAVNCGSLVDALFESEIFGHARGAFTDAHVRRRGLLRLMTHHRGNVSRAALEAGKERRDLGKLLKRHGLDPRWFASGTAARPMTD